MRKIETLMNAAIQNNQNWQSGNTSVHFDEESGVSTVHLHGNKIAEVGDTFIRLFDGGWQSTTTKSRLNAILAEHGDDGDCVCLLYTSPSPRDQRGSRMPSSA